MKIKLSVTLDVHLRDYATEYGITDDTGRPDMATAATDVRQRVRDAVRAGDFDEMINSAWPALGDLSTTHVEIAAG